MQIKVEEMINTRNGIFTSILNASTMSKAFKFTGFPFAGGGVAGRKKQKSPKTNAEIAARLNMFVLRDQPKPPTTNPAAIHPIVPQTRREGNLF